MAVVLRCLSGKNITIIVWHIKNGVFVSPSRMEAESYGVRDKIHTKRVALTDVAWIDAGQGQYAKVDDNVKNSLSDIASADKESANTKSDTKTGVKHSLSAETETKYNDAVKNNDIETAQKIVDDVAKENGYTIKAYHGTARGDRVGNVFLPERATSGPMAFFTDNREIAENYAKSNQDTSIAYDPDFDRYETQFRIKTKYQDMPLYRAWGFLPFDARNRITKKAGQLREDWDGDNDLILDPENNEANGGFQWQLKEARGNTLLALNEQWLNSGTLFNEENRFLDVLEMAGVTEEFKKIGMDTLYFKDPKAKHEKVYDTFLKITNPFDTANVDEQFIDGLLSWYENQDEAKYVRESVEIDLWDKNSIDAYDFAERLKSDIENNTFHAWTSIPDSVTDYLKELGYDGIKDLGGKGGGVGHTVWIPFSSEQIKSADAITYDDNGNVIPLSERFNEQNNDIRYSVKYTDQNKPVVVVNDDISRYTLNDKELINAVKKSIGKFNYVPIDRQRIYFTGNTKKETTFSKYTQWLRKNDSLIYQDKMRLLNHPMDIIIATTDYVNEGLNHPRKDNVVDFARGNLLIDVLGNKYEADVVIGFTKFGKCELYDIVNMKQTSFEYKKEASYKDSFSNKELSQKGNASFEGNISQKNKKVNTESKNSLKDDYVIDNNFAVMTKERILREIEDSSAGTNKAYARRYITTISPTDYLNLTTGTRTREFFDEKIGGDYGNKMGEYDYDSELAQNEMTPYLMIDLDNKRVIGHDGRHRMRALEKKGIDSVEIVVEFYNQYGMVKYPNGYDGVAEAIRFLNVIPQDFKYLDDDVIEAIEEEYEKDSPEYNDAVKIASIKNSINNPNARITAVTLEDVMPLNRNYQDRILATYGEDANKEASVKYSQKETPRDILLSTFSGLAQNDIEQK